MQHRQQRKDACLNNFTMSSRSVYVKLGSFVRPRTTATCEDPAIQKGSIDTHANNDPDKVDVVASFPAPVPPKEEEPSSNIQPNYKPPVPDDNPNCSRPPRSPEQNKFLSESSDRTSKTNLRKKRSFYMKNTSYVINRSQNTLRKN